MPIEPDPNVARPSRVALAVKGWRCFLGWHSWHVRNVVGRYISGRERASGRSVRWSFAGVATPCFCTEFQVVT